MPQLTQLSDVILSQLFWLLLVLGFIYFVIGRGMVPKILSTVHLRDKKIAADLAAAEAAKAEVDRTEEAYRARMDESRNEAAKLTAKAKQDGAVATEGQLAKADAEIQAKIGAAETGIRSARASAVGEIETIATELARDIAAKVAGLTVTSADAAQAVRAALAHG